MNQAKQEAAAPTSSVNSAGGEEDRLTPLAGSIAVVARQLAVLQRVLAVTGVVGAGPATAPVGLTTAGASPASDVMARGEVERVAAVPVAPLSQAATVVVSDAIQPEARREAASVPATWAATPAESGAPATPMARGRKAAVPGIGLMLPAVPDFAAFAPAMMDGLPSVTPETAQVVPQASLVDTDGAVDGVAVGASLAPGQAARQVSEGGMAPTAWPSVAPPAGVDSGRSGQGDVFLDGMRMGRWMTEHLARQAGRPPAGGSAFDPRMGIAWTGMQQGN